MLVGCLCLSPLHQVDICYQTNMWLSCYEEILEPCNDIGEMTELARQMYDVKLVMMC